MKKRILFLMSDTGGGHRAAAQAIEEAIHHLYPDTYEVFIEDIWKRHTPWPINRLPDSYSWLTGPGLPLWKFMWSSSSQLKAHKLVLPSISPILERKIIRYLKFIRPDIVVSVHPLMNHLGLKWSAKSKLDIPFVTVVTDMVTLHPLWICPRVTCCIVPTDAARDFAVRQGMRPEKIEVCGQPVSLKFTAMPGDKQALRHKLGLDLQRRAVLIIGGGEGSGRVFEIARAIAQTVPQAQQMIVSGRNKALKEKLEAVDWEIPTQVYGFVNNMPELMKAADILVTKAGPGTISEAFIAGLPPVISGFIPGQEQGNVTYVQEHQAGAYADTPADIARLVLSWMDPNNSILQQMSLNATKLARPTASLNIAQKICSLIKDRSQLYAARPETSSNYRLPM
ncbi:MAG: glycosyltransferase [Chloroflexota bacterium]